MSARSDAIEKAAQAVIYGLDKLSNAGPAEKLAAAKELVELHRKLGSALDMQKFCDTCGGTPINPNATSEYDNDLHECPDKIHVGHRCPRCSSLSKNVLHWQCANAVLPDNWHGKP